MIEKLCSIQKLAIGISIDERDEVGAALLDRFAVRACDW